MNNPQTKGGRKPRKYTPLEARAYKINTPACTMKICLTLKNSNSTFTPLPLMCLKAALLDLGHCDDADVSLLEFDPGTPVEDMVAGILGAEPDVLGLSCYVWNVNSLIEAGRRA